MKPPLPTYIVNQDPADGSSLLGAAGNHLIGTEREVGLWNTALNAAQMLELTTKNYPFN